MTLFVLIGRDGPDGASLRRELRPAHLQHLGPIAAAGRVRVAGPRRDDSGAPCGSVIIFEAEGLSAARAIAERDPYVSGGVFASSEVFETTQVFPERSTG
jgi:uncharacterized protein YciI